MVIISKITKIVRRIWLDESLWFIIPVNPEKRHPDQWLYTKPAIELQTKKPLQKQKNLSTQRVSLFLKALVSKVYYWVSQ